MALCGICHEACVLVAITPCGHEYYCSACVAKVAKCPCCRTDITGTLRVYRDNEKRQATDGPHVSLKRLHSLIHPSDPYQEDVPERTWRALTQFIAQEVDATAPDFLRLTAGSGALMQAIRTASLTWGLPQKYREQGVRIFENMHGCLRERGFIPEYRE